MTTEGIHIKLEEIEIDKDGKVIIKNKRLAEEIKELTTRAPRSEENFLDYKCNQGCKK